ncbi:hypothetical protein [Marasmitruncus massiliensis]|uniref:hypothetical protein n=1 Tax=Marasmitruncus massiliensis TaxID=1944642 RepID=UPI000C7E4208|nr:hypothetical protein [Marasmitruncus massiliensis]
MKTFSLITGVICAVVFLTACQKSDENNPSSAVQSQQQMQSEESSTQPEAESEISQAAGSETELSVTGTVKDATMNFVVLTGEDGGEYSFSTGGADKSGLKNGLLLGMKITVFYQENSNYPGSYTAIRLVDA